MIARAANCARGRVPLIYCCAGDTDITEFVQAWYHFDSTQTISSLYTFLEAGEKSGFIPSGSTNGTVVMLRRSDNIIYKSMFDFTSEEKEITTNTEGDSLMLGTMPGTRLAVL